MEALIEICLITVNNQLVQEDRIQEIVYLLENGWRCPPIVLRKISNTEYRVVDGRHRLEAHNARVAKKQGSRLQPGDPRCNSERVLDMHHTKDSSNGLLIR